MAEDIQISQGDYILYSDTSIGAPDSRSWSFIGGHPNSSNAINPIIQYNAPNNNGYNVALTISKGNAQVTKKMNNIIKVTPESGELTLSVLPTGIYPIGTNVIYSANSEYTALYYTWNIPGASAGTTGTSNTKAIQINDWKEIKVDSLGSTYSTYSTNANATIKTVAGNNITSQTLLIGYSKNGPDEELNFLDVKGLGSDGQTATYYNVYDTGYFINGHHILGMSPNYPDVLNNINFRGHLERLYYHSPSMDIPYGILNGNVIASGDVFQQIGLSNVTGWQSLERFIVGNYMIKDDSKNYFGGRLFFTDNDDILKKYAYRSDENPGYLISNIFGNNVVASQSSRSLELNRNALPVATILEIPSDSPEFYPGCCLPASSILNGEGLNLYLDLYLSPDFTTRNSVLAKTIEISISANGDPGNSINGMLVLAHDFGGRDGIASIINNMLIYNGIFDYIQCSASAGHGWNINGLLPAVYNEMFQGLQISIIKNSDVIDINGIIGHLVKVKIRDNFSQLSVFTDTVAAGSDIFDLRDTEKIIGRTPYNGNWLCFNYNHIINPIHMIYDDRDSTRGLSYGSL